MRNDSGQTLVIGGYGAVGRRISELLAHNHPGMVTIAGRDIERGRRIAGEIGFGVKAMALDINAPDEPDILKGYELVIACVDQTDPSLVEAHLQGGGKYMDISAQDSFLQQVESLKSTAVANGGLALLSVGVAPGITNVLAAEAVSRMERTARIEIIIEFGLGDSHGSAALNWMLNNLDSQFIVRNAGIPQKVRSLADYMDLALPGSKTVRRVYRFNVADQHAVARQTHIPSVSTWILFEDPLSGRLGRILVVTGLGSLLRRPFWRSLATRWFSSNRLGSDRCNVYVRATGLTSSGDRSMWLGVRGRQETEMTAIVAAAAGDRLLDGGLPPGVFHMDQVLDYQSVTGALRRGIPELEMIEEISHSAAELR